MLAQKRLAEKDQGANKEKERATQKLVGQRLSLGPGLTPNNSDLLNKTR